MEFRSHTLTETDYRDIARAMGITLDNVRTKEMRSGAHSVSFVLRPVTGSPTEWAKLNYSMGGRNKPRRVHAISWEGHYVFMRTAFYFDSNLQIRSMRATWHNFDEFQEGVLETGYENAGSIIYPETHRSQAVKWHSDNELEWAAFDAYIVTGFEEGIPF